MELFNRVSGKTPVAQPFLAVAPCHGSGFNRDKKPLATDSKTVDFLRSLLEDFPHGRITLKPLLSILGLAILLDIGPILLDAVAPVSLVMLQIFLELCQLSLAIFQIFGR